MLRTLIKRVGITVGVVATFALGIYFVSDITRKDIAAANAFTRLVESEPLSAGDIVVVPEKGPLSRICNAMIAPEDLTEEEKSGRYFNRAHNIIAASANIARSLNLLSEAKAKSIALRSELHFVGQTSALNGGTYTYINPDDCHCAIVRSLARGDRVCNVSSSLIETGIVTTRRNNQPVVRPVKRSIAVTLKRHVVRVPEAMYEACGVPYSPEARIAEQKLCTDKSRMPLDVKIRQKLNLIDTANLEQVIAASVK